MEGESQCLHKYSRHSWFWNTSIENEDRKPLRRRRACAEDYVAKIGTLYVALGFKDHSEYTPDRARTPIRMFLSGVRLTTLF